MDSRNIIDGAIYTTRRWPVALRYAATCALVVAVLALRQLADPILGDHERSLLFLAAILLAATLFDRGSGILATLLSALAVSYVYMPPRFSLVIGDRAQLASLLLFGVIGVLLASVVEAMHRAIEGLQEAQRNLTEVQRARALLLEEFRHRTRNDLGSLVGILLLRARAATSEAARDGLREAADHAMALARVHTRLANDSVAAEDASTVDTREFRRRALRGPGQGLRRGRAAAGRAECRGRSAPADDRAFGPARAGAERGDHQRLQIRLPRRPRRPGAGPLRQGGRAVRADRGR